MKLTLFTLVTFTLAAVLAICGCQEVTVFPEGNQFAAADSSVNITFSCNISVPDGNPMQTIAVWVINERQINVADVSRLQDFGVLITILNQTMISIVFTREGRQASGRTFDLLCAASTPGPPSNITFGPLLSVVTYGPPDAPGQPQVSGSNPTSLSWGRPANVPVGLVVTYTIVANSTSLNLLQNFNVVGMTRQTLQELERLALNGSEQCQRFTFTVVASLQGVQDSEPSSTVDTIPLSTDVGPINTSLHVNSLTFNTADTVSVGLFFKAAETCNTNFPLDNYTVLVAGARVQTFPAPSSAVVTLLFSAPLPLNRHFLVAVEACTSVICRTSNTTSLNTSDVQTALVVFFENSIFLSCSFARGSLADGCVFLFQVNQNGSAVQLEEFVVKRSGLRGALCSTSVNQRNGYMELSVLDLEQGGAGRGTIVLPVEEQVLETEEDFRQRTGCSVQRDVVADMTAVAVAVPVLLILIVVALVTVSLIYYFYYYKQHKHIREIEKRQPELKVLDGDFDTLILDIKSDHDKIIKEPMPDSIKPYRSLPHDMTVQMDGSLKESHPIEVELHRDMIRFKVNKTALKAAARFHSLVKKQHADASIDPEDAVSLMALSHATSRVHFKETFTAMCEEVLPQKEVEEEEEGLRSWAMLHYNPPTTAVVTPPISLTSVSNPKFDERLVVLGGHDTVDSLKYTKF